MVVSLCCRRFAQTICVMNTQIRGDIDKVVAVRALPSYFYHYSDYHGTHTPCFIFPSAAPSPPVTTRATVLRPIFCIYKPLTMLACLEETGAGRQRNLHKQKRGYIPRFCFLFSYLFTIYGFILTIFCIHILLLDKLTILTT